MCCISCLKFIWCGFQAKTPRKQTCLYLEPYITKAITDKEGKKVYKLDWDIINSFPHASNTDDLYKKTEFNLPETHYKIEDFGRSIGENASPEDERQSTSEILRHTQELINTQIPEDWCMFNFLEIFSHLHSKVFFFF